MNQAGSTDPVVRERRLWLAVLVALAIGSYLPSLAAPFFIDDYLHLDRLGELSSGSASRAMHAWVLSTTDAAAWWTDPSLSVEYFRPLVHVSFWIDHAIWGLRPAPYHAMNLAMYACVVLLGYGIALRVLGPGLRVWFAAALFALHPSHTESADWVSGRTDLLAALFMYGSVYAYLRSRPSEGGGLGWSAVCLFALVLALLSKENAIVLPALLILHALYAEPRISWRRLTVPLAAGALAIGYLGLRIALFGGLRRQPYPFVHAPGTPDWIWYAISGPVMHLMDLILFIPADPVITQPFWRGHLFLFALLGGGCVLGFLQTIQAASDWRTRILGLGWLVLPLAPITFGLPAERFVFIPSLGYCMLIGAKLPVTYERLSPGGRKGIIALGAFIALFTLVKSILFTSLSWKSRQVVVEALTEVDRMPLATTLAVVDLPGIAGMGFAHALNVERPERQLHVELLSLSQEMWPDGEEMLSDVKVEPPDRVLVDHGSGPAFLGSFMEVALLGDQPPFQAGQTIDRPGVSVHILQAAEGLVQRFEAQIKGVTDGGLLVMQGAGLHLKPVPVPQTADPSTPRGARG